jgi:hypothetical protein
MKFIIALFCLLPFSIYAQDSCQLKKETDPFTHQTKISTGFVPFTVNGIQLAVSIDATNTDVDFFFWIKKDGKCFDDASTVQINYDGERLKASYKNTGSMNCEGAFHFTFRNTPNTPPNLERLRSRMIASMKFNGPNKEVTELVFSEEQKQNLLHMAACVVRDSKTLLK